MKINKDQVVLLRYRLSNDAGEVLEDALKDKPVALLHGRGNVIRGLENALIDRVAGDRRLLRITGSTRALRFAVCGSADLQPEKSRGHRIHSRPDLDHRQ